MSIIELSYFLAGGFVVIGFIVVMYIIEEVKTKKEITKKFNQGRKLSNRRKVKK